MKKLIILIKYRYFQNIVKQNAVSPVNLYMETLNSELRFLRLFIYTSKEKRYLKINISNIGFLPSKLMFHTIMQRRNVANHQLNMYVKDSRADT